MPRSSHTRPTTRSTRRRAPSSAAARAASCGAPRASTTAHLWPSRRASGADALYSRDGPSAPTPSARATSAPTSPPPQVMDLRALRVHAGPQFSISRLRREVDVLRSLRHDGIVRLFGACARRAVHSTQVAAPPRLPRGYAAETSSRATRSVETSAPSQVRRRGRRLARHGARRGPRALRRDLEQRHVRRGRRAAHFYGAAGRGRVLSPRGDSKDWSRRRRGRADAAIPWRRVVAPPPWRRVAAPPRPRRG